MPATNLAFGTVNRLQEIFGSGVPNLNPMMAGGVLNVHPSNAVGTAWSFNALTSQYNAIPNDGTLDLVLAPQTNLRYLPWHQDHCTGMELDGDARIFMTGPINGCSFMMARDQHTNQPIILHANDNQHPGNSAARNNAQLQLAVNYLNVFHNGTAVVFETQYERDMGARQGWIIGADVHGDQRTWRIYCIVSERRRGFRPNYYLGLGQCVL